MLQLPSPVRCTPEKPQDRGPKEPRSGPEAMSAGIPGCFAGIFYSDAFSSSFAAHAPSSDARFNVSLSAKALSVRGGVVPRRRREWRPAWRLEVPSGGQSASLRRFKAATSSIRRPSVILIGRPNGLPDGCYPTRMPSRTPVLSANSPSSRPTARAWASQRLASGVPGVHSRWKPVLSFPPPLPATIVGSRVYE